MWLQKLSKLKKLLKILEEVYNSRQTITQTLFTELPFGSKRSKIWTTASVVIVKITVSGHFLLRVKFFN